MLVLWLKYQWYPSIKPLIFQYYSKTGILLFFLCLLNYISNFLFFWECHAMVKWCEIIAFFSYSILSLRYYKMVPSNNSIKQFHQMISSNNFIKRFHQTISSNDFIKQFHQTISSNDFVKQFHQMILSNNFHNMEISMESWRFCTRSRFQSGLVPPSPL